MATTRQVTGTLTELLPPVGWADLATGHDLDALGHRMDARMSDLRTELRTEVAGLRTEMADLLADLLDQVASGQRLLQFGMLTAMFTLAGFVWAAATVAA